MLSQATLHRIIYCSPKAYLFSFKDTYNQGETYADGLQKPLVDMILSCLASEISRYAEEQRLCFSWLKLILSDRRDRPFFSERSTLPERGKRLCDEVFKDIVTLAIPKEAFPQGIRRGYLCLIDF